MRIIFRKLLFLFILFVMPFVSSNAFAACKRIVFAYAPIASDTTNVVEIVRYYNDSANTWFVDAGCSGTGTKTVEIPLRGVFDKIPVVFIPSASGGYIYSNSIISLGRDAAGYIECSRNMPDVLTCGLGRNFNTTQIVEGYYIPQLYYNNVYGSCRIGTFSYETGSLVHECLAGGCTSFPVKGIGDTTLKTFYYDSSVDSSVGFYYEDSECSQFLGSFDLTANPGLNQTSPPLPIAFNAGSNVSQIVGYNVLQTGLTQVADSRGAGIYCNYDQATDYVNSVATATCQFNYNISFRGGFWVNAVLTPAAITPGTVSVYRNTEDGYSYVKPTYPCHKVDIYYMISNGSISRTPVTVYNNQKGGWFSDAACETSISNIEIPATFGVPIVYAASSGYVPSKVDASYFVTTIEDQTTPIMCNYNYSTNQSKAFCTPRGNFAADTSLYPRTYVASTTTLQSFNVESTVDDTNNKVDIKIFGGDGTCFAVDLLLNMDGATAGNITRLYRKTGSADLYYDERCSEIYNETYATVLPKKDGYTLRGFFTTQYAVVSESVTAVEFAPVLNYLMRQTNSADGITSLYAAWAKNCDSSIANGTCSLQIGPRGQVGYTITCNDGYSVVDDNTANASCTDACYLVELIVLGSPGGQRYYTNGTEWFGDESCTNPQGLVLPNAPDGQVILYFSNTCKADSNIKSNSATVEYDALTDVSCTYSSDTDVTTCNFPRITDDMYYCASDFAMKCDPQSSAGCKLDVIRSSIGTIMVDYTNCCLAGYHDENGVSSTLPVGQTSCE
ncbi:MAG: hypothetical protein IJN91_00350 [Alphaproteobacteria bacterium]|nr:hypothetical protein [Alphaproteobacteria bacterium]